MKLTNPVITWINVVHYFVLLVVFLIIYPYIFDTKLFLGGDNANYYILAKGLASGNGYSQMNLPIPVPANHFPPGYSFLMSLLMRIGLDSLFAMKVFNGFLLLFSSVLTYHLVLKLFPPSKIIALLISSLLLLNTNVLEYSTTVMSEVSFLTMLLVTIHLFIILAKHDYSYKSIYFYLFLASLILLIYIRSQGLVFVIAASIILVMKKKWLTGTLCVLFVVLALLPWQIRSHNLGGNSYMKQLMRVNPYISDSPQMELGTWVIRIKKNFVRYTSKEIPKLVVPALEVKYKNNKTGGDFGVPFYYWLIGVSIIGIVVVGIWSLKKHRIFFLLLFAGTFSIHMLWPDVWFGVRFLLPMTPLIYLFLVFGFLQLAQVLIKPKQAKVIVALAFVPFLLLSFPTSSATEKLHLKAEKKHPKNWRNFLRLSEWSKENLPDSSVISNRKPGLFYVNSAHKTLSFPSTTDEEVFYEFFKKNKVTHVVIEQLGFNQTGKYLSPVVSKGKDKFKLVQSYDTEKLKQKNEKGEVIDVDNPYGAWLFEYLPEMGYQGKYKNGLREGKGVYYFQNGNVFTGTWKNDSITGHGIFHVGKSEILEGNWTRDKKNGPFFFKKNNRWFECNYVDDVIQSAGFVLDNDKKRVQPIRFK